MLNKLFYFVYSDDDYFERLNEDQKQLFITNRLNSNKFVFKICFALSCTIVLFSYFVEGVKM